MSVPVQKLQKLLYDAQRVPLLPPIRNAFPIFFTGPTGAARHCRTFSEHQKVLKEYARLKCRKGVRILCRWRSALAYAHGMYKFSPVQRMDSMWRCKLLALLHQHESSLRCGTAFFDWIASEILLLIIVLDACNPCKSQCRTLDLI